MPHLAQTWKSAVFVPNEYFDTREGSLTCTLSEPVGQEVQTPPCFTQNEQVQARAGISDGAGSQRSANEMFPQWHFPEISIDSSFGPSQLLSPLSGCRGRRRRLFGHGHRELRRAAQTIDHRVGEAL